VQSKNMFGVDEKWRKSKMASVAGMNEWRKRQT
jgi:hypothetical protein